MFTTLLAYVMIGFFFAIDRFARQGKQAKSLERGIYDRGSTGLLTVAFVIAAAMLLAAPFLNLLGIGSLTQVLLIGWLGLVLMALSLMMRLWANKALGMFYTRTLRVIDDHHVVQSGPYRVVRHPGYLGVILMWVGGGLAVLNVISVIVALISMLIAYMYRIRVEERMLAVTQGDEYRDYQAHTWRLIPLLY
ncbi:MAG: isoprenylcysteine carboxylmethyltransferase family protein [Anaerolineae bacterium]